MCENPRDKFQSMTGKPPEEAKFFWSGGPIEVAERTWFSSVFSGVVAFETDEGMVLVDTGTEQLAPALAGLLRTQSSAPVHTAIYTHGHADHAFGLKPFLRHGQAKPQVIGQSNMPARFARYEKTRQHNATLNARQFGGVVETGERQHYDLFTTPQFPPNRLYDDELDIVVGGIRFELRHCKGETDDHTWIYCPDRGVLCPGDLFIWGVPNAGNPQKAQRYPWSWAEGLRQMAATEARTLCPGHGGPVIDDPEKVQRMLCETADYLETIVTRTLELMEDGSPPHVDIVHAVELPRSDAPWLQSIYDEGEFIVRNVMRYFGGWHSGRPSELKPASRRGLAQEMCALSGGAARLAARAQSLAAEGDLRLACHLIDYALEAEPDNETVREATAAIYETRATQETSLMAINLYRSAAAYARDGRAYA